MSTSGSLASLLEHYFTQRLMQQRRVCPHTTPIYSHLVQVKARSIMVLER